MKRSIKKNNQKRLLIIGLLVISILGLLPKSYHGRGIANTASRIEIENFFLNGDYENKVKQGEIATGLVRERLNQAHHNLTGQDLPEKLIQ
jgi:hypothetical protein